MLSSLEGEQFEPDEPSPDGFVLFFQDEYRIPKLVNDKSPIIINALQSSEKAGQSIFYVNAFQLLYQHYPEIYDRFNIKYLLNKDIRMSGMTPEDVVDWLISANIYLIYSHVHQGNVSKISLKFKLYFSVRYLLGLIQNYANDPNADVWHVKIIESEFDRLRYHVGVPDGSNLKCPIFLQNKCAYAFAIAEYSLPSLVVPFDIDIDDESTQSTILRYVSAIFLCQNLTLNVGFS